MKNSVTITVILTSVRQTGPGRVQGVGLAICRNDPQKAPPKLPHEALSPGSLWLQPGRGLVRSNPVRGSGLFPGAPAPYGTACWERERGGTLVFST